MPASGVRNMTLQASPMADPDQAWRRHMMIILALAVVLRVTWAFFVPVIPLWDSEAYDLFARNIVEHGVYGPSAGSPTAFWPVGTSALYALSYWIFGYSYVPLVGLHILLSVIIVLASARIVRRCFPQWPLAAPLAGLVLAVWPSLVLYVTVLASDLIFLAAFIVSIDIWTNKRLSPLARGIGAGIFFAAASYVRAPALLLPFVLSFGALIAGEGLKRSSGLLLSATLTMALLIAPWTIRNYQVFGNLVVISTNGGTNLWIGNHPGSDGGYSQTPDYVAGLNEYEASKLLGNEARQYIMGDIPGFILQSVKRLAVTHAKETIAVVFNEASITKAFGARALLPFKLIASAFWLAMLLLAAIGLVMVAKGSRTVLEFLANPLLLSSAYLAAVHTVFIGHDRFHFSSIPLAAALAAVALIEASRALRKTRSQAANPPSYTR